MGLLLLLRRNLLRVNATYDTTWQVQVQPISEAPLQKSVSWNAYLPVSTTANVSWITKLAVVVTKSVTWDIAAGNKTQFFVDTFNGPSYDSRWTSSSNASIVSGRSRVASPSGGFVETPYIYDFSNSSMSVKVDISEITGAGATTHMGVVTNSGDGSKFVRFQIVGSNLGFVVNNASVGSITYNSVSHAYLRVRHSGTTVYADTSPDGFTWTNRFSATNTENVTASKMLTGSYSGATGYAYFDDLNYHLTATQNFDTTWYVNPSITQVSTTKAVTWNANASLVKTASTDWTVLVPAVASALNTWVVRERVAKSVSTDWQTLSTLAKTASTSWLNLAVVDRTLEVDWQVLSSLLAEFEVEWGFSTLRDTRFKKADGTWASILDQDIRIKAQSGWVSLSDPTVQDVKVRRDGEWISLLYP